MQASQRDALVGDYCWSSLWSVCPGASAQPWQRGWSHAPALEATGTQASIHFDVGGVPLQ